MAKSHASLIALFCLFTVSIALTQPGKNDVTTAVVQPLNDAVPIDTKNESLITLPLTRSAEPINTKNQSLITLPLTGSAEPINTKNQSLITLPLTGSDADHTLRLPSETVNNELESKSDAATSVPLTTVTFRTVNRRFHVRSKHPCRHRFGKLFPSLREPMEIPYGNDMIVSSGENSDFVDPMVHGGEQRKLDRPERLHHHHHHHQDKDEDSDNDDQESESAVEQRKLDRPVRLHHHQHDKDEDSDSDDEDDDWMEKMMEKKLRMLKKIRTHFRHHHNHHEEEEKQEEGGFMVRVRKFLAHHF